MFTCDMLRIANMYKPIEHKIYEKNHAQTVIKQ